MRAPSPSIRGDRTSKTGRNGDNERGAALIEFAIALTIFVALLALIFDAGLGYSASRSSASAARSASRVGALAGESRDADYRILDALRAQYGDGSTVQQIIVYRSTAANTNGDVTCSGPTDGTCNVYNGSVLGSLSRANFGWNGATNEWATDCQDSDFDSEWCPIDRRADAGDFIGVYIRSNSDAAVGIGASEFQLEDRAVFALYFPPEPATTVAN